MPAADPAEPLAPASRLDLHQEWLRLQSVQWRIVVMRTHYRRSPQGQFALKVTGMMVIAALSFAIPLLFI